jgi:hypothetical protein
MFGHRPQAPRSVPTPPSHHPKASPVMTSTLERNGAQDTTHFG